MKKNQYRAGGMQTLLTKLLGIGVLTTAEKKSSCLNLNIRPGDEVTVSDERKLLARRLPISSTRFMTDRYRFCSLGWGTWSEMCQRRRRAGAALLSGSSLNRRAWKSILP